MVTDQITELVVIFQHLMNKKLIETVMDAFLEEYQKDRTVIYGDEQQKLSLYYRYTSKYASKWKKINRCIYGNCNRPSVHRSHTIQRSSSLDVVAENGIVLTPEYTLDGIVLKKMGLKWASTFPGYCEEHERLFDSYERRKKISTGAHCALQVYRSICREVFRLKQEIASLKEGLHKHISIRNSYIANKIEKDAGVTVDISSVNLNNDIVAIVFENYIKKLSDRLRILQDYHLSQFEAGINSPHQKVATGIALEVDLCIPVCLSGLFTYNAKVGEGSYEVMSVVTVLPYEESTIIVISGRNEDDQFIQKYIAEISGNLALLNMIESWMVFSTDNWFLKPSVWESLKPTVQESILHDFRHADYSSNYKHSIFNEIRMKFIEIAKTHSGDTDYSDGELANIERELNKITRASRGTSVTEKEKSQ